MVLRSTPKVLAAFAVMPGGTANMNMTTANDGNPPAHMTISGPARVIDGDTVVVASPTVRLKGVDAAEMGTERGEAARRAMTRIVTGALTCRLTGEKTWGREVGYCTTAAVIDALQLGPHSGQALGRRS
jgi:endonuclease YncB( thermonuclease family)